MKLRFTLQNESATREQTLELNALPAAKETRGKLEVKESGAHIEADWAEIEPQTYSILLNRKSFDVRLDSPRGPGGGPFTAHVGGRIYLLELRDPRRVRKSGGAGAHDGPLDIFAPMPGRIVKILAAVGTEVRAGESLMVIEAMKMQNEIRAPRSGRVESIRAKEGEGVESGAPLLRLA